MGGDMLQSQDILFLGMIKMVSSGGCMVKVSVKFSYKTSA